MKLHPIHKDHFGKSWCGIIALSAITGNPTEHSRQVLKQAIDETGMRGNKRQVLKGIYTDEILAALKYMCVDTQLVNSAWHTRHGIKKASLARFLHMSKPKQGNLFLVLIPEHFLVTDGVQIIDSAYQNPIPIWQYSRLDDEVEYCYECKELQACEL